MQALRAAGARVVVEVLVDRVGLVEDAFLLGHVVELAAAEVLDVLVAERALVLVELDRKSVV